MVLVTRLSILRLALSFAVLMTACFVTGQMTLAQDGTDDDQGTKGQLIGSLFKADLVDEIFNRHVSQKPEDHLPTGVQIAIVDKAGNHYIKGYGLAGAPDKAREAMDPTRHLYRIASQTKVFTAIAILQLHESGLLDLDADINNYLQLIHARNPYGDKKITARLLLHHRSGLDDDWQGIAVQTQAEHRPLAEAFLKRGIRFARPADEVTAYSNRSYMLLGHLIEAISRQAYEDFIQHNILDPLEMKNTHFLLPEGDKQNLAWGTAAVGDKFIELWIADTLTRPSGDLMSTAEDMSHYLAALLGNGSYNGKTILQPQTLELMKTDCVLMGPGLPGHCLGPFTMVRDGIRSWEHGGGHLGYRSHSMIDPERGFAIFVGYNGNVDMAKFFDRDFLGTFYPAEIPTPKAQPITHAAEIVGFYRRNYSSHMTAEKIASISAAEVEVKVAGDKLYMPPLSYVQIEPYLFRALEVERYLKFLTDDAGTVRYLQEGSLSLTKLQYYETNKFQPIFLYSILSLMALTLLWGGWILWTRAANLQLLEKIAVIISMTGSIAWIATAVLTYFMSYDFLASLYSSPSHFAAGLMVSKIALSLTFVMVIFSLWIAIFHRDTPFNKVGYYLASLAAVAMSAWAFYWQIL